MLFNPEDEDKRRKEGRVNAEDVGFNGIGGRTPPNDVAVRTWGDCSHANGDRFNDKGNWFNDEDDPFNEKDNRFNGKDYRCRAKGGRFNNKDLCFKREGDALYQDALATFALDPIECIGGGLPRTQQRLVEAWAEIHHAELLRDWELLQSGQRPLKIEPLQ